MWRTYLAVGVLLAATTACSDGGGSLSPSGTSASLGSSGSSGTSGAGTSTASTGSTAGTAGTSTLASTGTTSGLLSTVADTTAGTVDGVTSTVGSVLGGTTGGTTTSDGVTVATGTATPSGQPLLNGALLSTDGVVGTGTTGLLTADTTSPNGRTTTAAINVPTPILANTQVLPDGANVGGLVHVGGGTSTGTAASNGGLLNGNGGLLNGNNNVLNGLLGGTR